MKAKQEYFLKIRDELEKFHKARDEWEEKASAIFKSGDAGKLKKYYDKHPRPETYLTVGMISAYRDYAWSIKTGQSVFVLDSILWDSDIQEYLKALEDGGIKEFVYGTTLGLSGYRLTLEFRKAGTCTFTDRLEKEAEGILFKCLDEEA